MNVKLGSLIGPEEKQRAREIADRLCNVIDDESLGLSLVALLSTVTATVQTLPPKERWAAMSLVRKFMHNLEEEDRDARPPQ